MNSRFVSRFFSWLYQAAVSIRPDSRLRSYCSFILWKIRNQALKFIDPEVHVPVLKRKLWMRLSHTIPILHSQNPFYDGVLARLASSIARGNTNVIMIDIGANIGDTICPVASRVAGRFLCVEPDPDHFGFLVRNIVGFNSITCVRALLSDKEVGGLSLDKFAGTSFVASSSDGKIVSMTLDSLLEEQPAFRNANILKIDTDGFDFKILRGAPRLLTETKCVLYFEFSPEHYVKIGGEDPLAVFALLSRHGYNLAAFYDSGGYLMFECDPSSPEFIPQIVHWAHVKGLYFDILAFHAEMNLFGKQFIAMERELFPVFNRQYL